VTLGETLKLVALVIRSGWTPSVSPSPSGSPGEAMREATEKLAGLALIALGVILLITQLTF
jgi:hypothetical protein